MAVVAGWDDSGQALTERNAVETAVVTSLINTAANGPGIITWNTFITTPLVNTNANTFTTFATDGITVGEDGNYLLRFNTYFASPLTTEQLVAGFNIIPFGGGNAYTGLGVSDLGAPFIHLHLESIITLGAGDKVRVQTAPIGTAGVITSGSGIAQLAIIQL